AIGEPHLAGLAGVQNRVHFQELRSYRVRWPSGQGFWARGRRGIDRTQSRSSHLTVHIKGAIPADIMAFAIEDLKPPQEVAASRVRLTGVSWKHALFAGYFCLNEHQLAPIPGPAGFDQPPRPFTPDAVRHAGARSRPVRRRAGGAGAAGGVRA